MLAIPLVLLGLFGSFACTRGVLHLAKARVGSLHPEKEAYSITHIFLSSMFLAMAITFALFFPPLLADHGGLFTHAHSGNDQLHQLVADVSWQMLPAALALLLLFVVWAWLEPIVQGYRVHWWMRMLRYAADSGVEDVQFAEQLKGIENPFQGRILLVPGAWSGLVGVFQPTLLLGRELLDTLPSEELYALLAHEEAHRHRKDPLYRLLLLFCSRLLPWLGIRLFVRWAERTEELCDEYAAYRVGDPLIVATALVQTRRLQRQLHSGMHRADSEICPGYSGFTQQSNLETRVRRLLALDEAPNPPTAPQIRHFLTSKVALMFVLLQYPLHYTIEFIFSLFRV